MLRQKCPVEWEKQREHEHRHRIKDDAGPGAAGELARTIEVGGQSWEDDQVEEESGRSQHRRLPPREPAKREREAADRDMHGLAATPGVRPRGHHVRARATRCRQ